MPERQIFRADLALVDPQSLQHELQASLAANYLGLYWQPPDTERAGAKGTLEIYLAPSMDTTVVVDILNAHNPLLARQERQQRRDLLAQAQANLAQQASLLAVDWSITPPVDALNQLRLAVLDVVHIVRGLD